MQSSGELSVPPQVPVKRDRPGDSPWSGEAELLPVVTGLEREPCLRDGSPDA